MPVLLAVAAFLLLFALLWRSTERDDRPARGWEESFLLAATFWAALAVILTEALSAFDALAPAPVAGTGGGVGAALPLADPNSPASTSSCWRRWRSTCWRWPLSPGRPRRTTLIRYSTTWRASSTGPNRRALPTTVPGTASSWGFHPGPRPSFLT